MAVLILVASALKSQELEPEWVVTSGGDGGAQFLDLTVDRDGRVFTVGSFIDTVRFGDHSLTSAPYTGPSTVFPADACAVQWASNGQAVSAEQFGGGGLEMAKKVTTDPQGNLYVAGQFGLPIQLGGTWLSSSSDGYGGAFLFKQSPAGTLEWAVNAVDPNRYSTLEAIAVDRDSNSFVAGYVNVQTAAGEEPRAYVAKFDAFGVELWRHQGAGGASAQSSIGSMAVDAAGNCYVTGSYWAGATIAGQLLNSQEIGGYLAKLDAGGDLIWIRTLDVANLSIGLRIALDEEQNVHVCAREPNDFKDILATAKFDADGQYVDRRTLMEGEQGRVSPNCMLLTPSGDVYLAVQFFGQLRIGNTTLNSPGRYDSVLADFGPEGVVRKCVHLLGRNEGAGNTRLAAIATDPGGTLYMCGTFNTSGFLFGEATVERTGLWVDSSQSRTAFVAKLRTAIPPALRVARVGTGVRLAWPTSAAGFSLFAGASLGAGTEWNLVPHPPVQIGEEYVVELPEPGATEFFQLRKQ